MKKLLMLSASIALLAIGFSFFYYYVIFLPSEYRKAQERIDVLQQMNEGILNSIPGYRQDAL